MTNNTPKEEVSKHEWKDEPKNWWERIVGTPFSKCKKCGMIINGYNYHYF